MAIQITLRAENMTGFRARLREITKEEPRIATRNVPEDEGKVFVILAEKGHQTTSDLRELAEAYRGAFEMI